MKRVVVAVAGLMVVVLAALVLYLSFGDLGRFRPQVEAAISQAVGREFRIGGEFRPKLFPRPSIVAEGVTLANSDWAQPSPMLSVGRASVVVGLWSLVSGPVRVRRFELHDVAIRVEQNAEGAMNWSMGASDTPPAAAPSAPLQELPVVIELASIGNVTVLFARPGQDDMTATIASLELHTDESGAVIADGSGQLLGKPFTLTAAIARAANRRAQVELEAGITGVAPVQLQGLVSPQQIDFHAVVPDLAGLAGAFSIAALSVARLELDGSLMLGADRYELRGATAKLPGVESRIDAVVPRDGADDPIEIDIEIAAPDLAVLRSDLPMLAFAANAKARVSPNNIELDPVAINVGDSDFSGTAAVVLGEELSFVVTGESKLLDFTAFQQQPPDAQPQPPTAPAPAPGAGETPWLFSEEELPFEQLTSTLIEANIAIATLRSRDTEARNVVLALKNDGKTARLETKLEAQGGSLEGNVALAMADDSADLDVRFDARDLRLNLFSGDVEAEKIPPIGLVANLRSTGKSPRALAASASGSLLFTQGAGLIDNAAVGIVSSDIVAQIFGALNPFAKDEEHTSLDCTVIGLDVEEGVGTLAPLLAQSEKLMITGGGKIDLKTEKLDVEFNTKPRTGVGVTADMFVTPFVKLSGTLAEPGVGLNKGGTVVSGGIAVATGGLSLLAKGFADRITGERDQCVKALQEAPATSVPAPSAALN